MTQKELLYVEDAVEHEKSIITIVSDFLTKLNNSDLVSFLEEEIKQHNDRKDKLIALLKEKANER